MTVGVIVPVRGFLTGKARLGDRLDAPARAAFLESMATTVVQAAGSRPTVVVSSAPEVRSWAAHLAIDVIDDPGSLNAAADAGREYWRARGVARIAVVHADLPHARSLVAVDPDPPLPDPVEWGPVLAVACHRHDGTPAMSLPTAAPFRFAYGPDSFARHGREAERIGLRFVAVDDDGLRFDVDTVADLNTIVPAATS